MMGLFSVSFSDDWKDSVKSAMRNLEILEEHEYNKKFEYLLDFAIGQLERAKELIKKDKEKKL